MKSAEVAKLLAVIASAYPAFEVTDLKHQVWHEMLSDLDYQVANAAVKLHLASSRFAPTIAEIREQAVVAVSGPALTGTEAWGEFIAAVRQYSPYSDRDYCEGMRPLTRAVAEAFGLGNAAMSDNVDVLRGQFLKMFEQLSRRNNVEALAGRFALPSATRAAIGTGGDNGEAQSALPRA
jgi:Loader and inhibitor of phage G40P